MQHVIRYEGGYERNFGTMRSDIGQYEGSDGARHVAAPWPAADGVRFSFMEKPGKRFVAVRVQYEETTSSCAAPFRSTLNGISAANASRRSR
jgi:hypothetical protein